MDVRWAVVALLLVLVGLQFMQPGPEDSSFSSSSFSPRYGLGLEVPDASPEPGPFWETGDALTRLEEYMLDNVPRLGRQCGVEGLSIAAAVENGNYLTGISDAYDICISRIRGENEVTFEDPFNRMDRWVLRHMENGTVAQAYQEARERSVRELDETMRALDDAPTPADAVEAQLLAWLMEKTEWDYSILATADKFYNNSVEDQEFWGLTNGFLNLNRTTYDSWFTRLILDSYPWQDPDCVSNVDALVVEERVQGKLDAFRDRYMQHDEGTFRDKLEVQFNKKLESEFGLYAERDWWPGLLWLEQELDWWIAVAEHPGDVLPDDEEALYLVQAYRNQTRTLSTEKILGPIHPDVHRFIRWQDNPHMAAQVHTIETLQWRFGNVGCVE